jgi:hypothetical protein
MGGGPAAPVEWRRPPAIDAPAEPTPRTDEHG